MNLFERAKNVMLMPKAEWDIIDKETHSAGTIATSYVLPMLAIGALATFIGAGLIGQNVGFGVNTASVKAGLIGAVVYVVVMLATVFIVGAAIEGLAPSFGSEKNWNKSFALGAYSLTPAYVGGIFFIVPQLSILVIICTIYSIYPMYMGIPTLKKTPADKHVGYLAVVVLIGVIAIIVLGLIETEILKAILKPAGIGGGILG